MIHGGLLGAGVSALVALAISAGPAEAPAAAAAPGPRRASAPEREEEEPDPAPPAGVWDVAAHDMNGDGLSDLVIATGGPGSTSGTVSVLLNPGGDAPAADWERTAFATAADYGRVAVGDIDGDGIDDVAALTFSTRVLRWWLRGADGVVRDERSLSFAGEPLAGRQCAGPEPLTASPPTLASLAFADLDVDGALELGVAGYVSGAEGAVYLFSFERGTGCFVLRQGFGRATRGSLRLRFFDVQGDGALDVVTSHYALTRPRDPPPGCPECLEWGQWWSPERARGAPLLARFGDRALLAAEPTPELNVVDFDVQRAAGGPRFALAGSAHLCPASDCWGVGRAGFVSVVDATGRELWSGDAWKARVEQAPPVVGARLLPRAVSFFDGLGSPALVAGHWWATRHKNSPCNRVSACGGPLAWGALGADPALLERGRFVQALAFAGSARGPVRQHCERRPGRLVGLPELPLSILSVRSGERALPASAHSWVPGSRVVSLSSDARRAGRALCVDYATSARPRLAVADSARGLSLIPLQGGGG